MGAPAADKMRPEESGPRFHPRPLIFLQMPKAGGTTLEEVIARQYEGGRIFRFTGSNENEADFRGLSEQERGAFDLLSGHTHFGVHEHVPSVCTYVTMLRHPLERVLSLYYFVQRDPEHYLHRHGFGDRRDVDDFVRRPITVETDNLQTRLLNPRPPLFVPPGGVTEGMLDRAAANLEEHFAVVGVTERFDETLEAMRRVFGWRDVSYEMRNVTSGRPGASDLPRSAVDAILEANAFDVRLHELADRLLSETLERIGPDRGHAG